MNARNAPLSPVSLGGSEWSYPPVDKDAPYPNNRGQLNTPPDSAGSVKAMNGGFPPGPRSVGGPSPPPSVGRSSAGTNLYARSESGRSQSQQIDNQEIVLSEHYVSLKRYLSGTSRDGNPKPPPNKARDKLQRLTGVQFLELSTDVYDELKRRELASRRPPNAPPGTGPPDYLVPEENFHPKRNQARQKLSSLGPPRFRDLATDVFCELERRYPRFAGGDIPRVGSPMSIRGPQSRSQTPVSGMNGYPPRGQSRRRPSEASSIRSARGPTPMNGGFGVPPSPRLPNGDYERPTPKQFQSNTIVPNKSTMVEEDDDLVSPLSPDPGEADAYGMGRMSADRESKRSAGPSETDKKLMEEYEQQQVTDEVRREAQDFLREMKLLSQQSGAAWERQAELEKTIESLENEVRDWRNRYARTKTQLRNMRASSLSLMIDQDAGKYVREKGFTQENGLVKDVHVTKFQISIDELLQRARVDNPERVIDSMKAVVVSVRRISKDIDESAPNNEDVLQQQAKLKSRVSSTANNLITASKNFASSAGISPVSLLDAAASHLVAAVVELLRTVKIRSTPAGELDDDDDGTITPVDSTGFFSPRSNGQSQVSSATSVQSSLPPPPAFQGLGGGNRTSMDSSAYSPVSSPRESYAKRPISRSGGPGNGATNGNGMGYGMGKNLPPIPNGFYGAPQQQDTRTEDLKIYLEDQTAVLVQTIQNLVQLIRNDADINQVTEEINTIADVVGQVVSETDALSSNGGELVRRLSACRERLIEAGKRGVDLAADGKDTNSREWRMWTQTLPPIAFEIARETKELVQRVDQLVMNDDGADDFA
ncbi:putative cell polarity protein [Lasiosphaeria hispida]|uniref:Cell polarity protein n=1 Tax=Lasiosphaeria hispida TaxID=260671 RepID=A0AAJ0HTX6_9PEZI|nr:putative cell polarity protein [Lasiosphaeria hispida]